MPVLGDRPLDCPSSDCGRSPGGATAAAACTRARRCGRPRYSATLEFVLDAAQLTFQNRHPFVEGDDGLLLGLGGSAVQGAHLAHELNLSVNSLSHRLDALQALLRRRRRHLPGPRRRQVRRNCQFCGHVAPSTLGRIPIDAPWLLTWHPWTPDSARDGGVLPCSS